MDWMEDMQRRYRLRRKVLFDRDSPLLQPLCAALAAQDHRALICWALELSQDAEQRLRTLHPTERRAGESIEAARLWARGEIRMPLARRKILDCHAIAREWDDAETIALCHAIGQACATVHTGGHAIGLPLYELTALVRRYGPENCRKPVEQRNLDYLQRLSDWQMQPLEGLRWAAFLLPRQGKSHEDSSDA